jgi:S1-C subfamily serine protease
MQLHIECPVCEQHITTPELPSNKKVICPSCSRKFKLSSASKVPPPRLPQKKKTADSDRLSAPTVTGKPEAQPSQAAVKNPLGKTETPDPQTSKTAGNQRLALALQKKRKRRFVSTLISTAILTIAIGVLTGLLVKQMRQNKVADNNQPQSSNPASLNPASPSTEPGEEILPDKSKPIPKTLKQQIPKDIPDQLFVQFDAKAAQTCWEAVQPNLLSLTVYDGKGTHQAVATIIDSRGWVLTNYSAVKGASKIEVTSSLKTIQYLGETKLLNDVVRGYIAVNKEEDLVILSVNRRFIVAFSTVDPITRNYVVKSEFLLQCAPPSLDNLYGGIETRILSRGTIDSLDAVAQATAQRMKLKNTDLVWFSAQTPTLGLPGTPLFKIDGDLAALLSFRVDENNFFVPVNTVHQLLADAEGDIKPLRELSPLSETSDFISISDNNPMRDAIVELNQLTESCKQFDWIPKKETEYKTLQSLIKSYVAIKKRTNEGAETETDKQIARQLVQLETTLNQRAILFSEEDQSALKQMNKSFAESTLQKPNQYLPIYGEVIHILVESDQILVRLVGTSAYIRAPFVPTDDPMWPESKWLFFVKTPQETKNITLKISAAETVSTAAVSEFYNFGQ